MMNSNCNRLESAWTRRELLTKAGGGLGALALSSILHEQGHAAVELGENPLLARKPHFEGKAKNVIWLFINGGPSHLDTWDYKPELIKRDGTKLEGFDPTTGFFEGAVGPLMKSPFEFKQHGESGAWVSSLFPHLSKHVDKMAFVKSFHTKSNNHSPALFMANTGVTRMGHPCVGSWVTYRFRGTHDSGVPRFASFVRVRDDMPPTR